MTMAATVANTMTSTPLTETGAAERFALVYGDMWRHDHRRSRWLHWSGDYWQPDTDGVLTRDAIDFARHWQAEAVTLATADERKATFTFAIGLERRDRQRNMLAIARDLLPIADAGEHWDSRTCLLGTPTGVVDLRTGALRRGRRDDRITMITGIEFDPQATSLRWSQALAEILPDACVRDYLQIALGYSTTGETIQDCWFLGRRSIGASVVADRMSFVMEGFRQKRASCLRIVTRIAAPRADRRGRHGGLG
jgi:putative DNA primase/helicase